MQIKDTQILAIQILKTVDAEIIYKIDYFRNKL